ncbi:MAG: ATP-dependent DNA helicase RecG [Cyclobacteriaceae bacterium]|jgi:ATP-dependent DNA helicase RecG
MPGFFDQSLSYLKGIGPQRAELLAKELELFTYGDLLRYFPFRYEDRTQFVKIKDLSQYDVAVQFKATIVRWSTVGVGHKQRLVGVCKDDTGEIELVWFKGANWVQSRIKAGIPYIIFGKPTRYGSTLNIAHPEVEPLISEAPKNNYLYPVYPLTDKLRKRFVDSKVLRKAIQVLLRESQNYLTEVLPKDLILKYGLIDRKSALLSIHFPTDTVALKKAQYRLKYEELLMIQLKLIRLKLTRIDKFRGIVFSNSELLNKFYKEYIPFELTGAQKKVIKEIYADFRSASQMNRLVQGDVGSGKTMVAFLCMLIAIGNGTQCALMAPTEILAEQHFDGLSTYAEQLGLSIARLTGSTKKARRKIIHEQLEDGSLQILVGTHALLEDKVKFKQLGLAVVDEQHRFGVAQRAKLWQKNEKTFPHILVMTATPIPRTLAMTLYGDLDISVIDELPAGRKPIQTQHMRDSQRIRMFDFLDKEVLKGRQIYIVYPLIEESSTMDYKDLMDGYESISRRFPNYPLSILHGRMKADDKEFEMRRFAKGETKIMVATTVIEVGVNVPNASVMVIENAERFGLSQLHQLRGRVGRGAEQSFCLLMTGLKLSKEAKTRIGTMVETNDGFKIAETDLKLRGPGDLMGTQQSGILDLKLADLSKDGEILLLARQSAIDLLAADPELTDYPQLAFQLKQKQANAFTWSRIS